MPIELELLPDAATAARRAASLIAEHAREALRERGRFLLALSGGSTPLPMFDALAREPLPSEGIELFQVDERVAPEGDAARNWTHIEQRLATPTGLSAAQLHPMPAAMEQPEAAAEAYARMLEERAGRPPILDLVHLGLGNDGHTASLFPGDAAIDIDQHWTTATGDHNGHRRITLTLPVLSGARSILWLVCGADKAPMLARLLAADAGIPAGRVSQASARIIADEAAGSALPSAVRSPR